MCIPQQTVHFWFHKQYISRRTLEEYQIIEESANNTVLLQFTAMQRRLDKC
jgi:hypothetical protein